MTDGYRVALFATFTFSRQSVQLPTSPQLQSLINTTATMSSSEEENFDINISDEESEEDYSPVVKKKATTTVRSGILAT